MRVEGRSRMTWQNLKDHLQPSKSGSLKILKIYNILLLLINSMLRRTVERRWGPNRRQRGREGPRWRRHSASSFATIEKKNISDRGIIIILLFLSMDAGYCFTARRSLKDRHWLQFAYRKSSHFRWPGLSIVRSFVLFLFIKIIRYPDIISLFERNYHPIIQCPISTPSQWRAGFSAYTLNTCISSFSWPWPSSCLPPWRDPYSMFLMRWKVTLAFKI